MLGTTGMWLLRLMTDHTADEAVGEQRLALWSLRFKVRILQGRSVGARELQSWQHAGQPSSALCAKSSRGPLGAPSLYLSFSRPRREQRSGSQTIWSFLPPRHCHPGPVPVLLISRGPDLE